MMNADAWEDVSIGIDFGTSNTVVALANKDGKVAAMRFIYEGVDHHSYPSALCFWEEGTGATKNIRVEGGPWAIDQFLEGLPPHRFIQSFKTYAASSAFVGTYVFQKKYEFEHLLAAFLRTFLKHAEIDILSAVKNVVIGRPVRFAGADSDDRLAMQRYRAAFANLGIAKEHYVYEPVGASFFFARNLKQDATVLVADFGGGTSDFSIMRFERNDERMRARPLGHAGIGIAGDTFDYRIIDHVVSPHLGKGGEYISFGKALPIPNHYYSTFARWNQLALMKTSREFRELKQLSKVATDPVSLQKFIDIIEDDFGLTLYQAVSKVKFALSINQQADFLFQHEKVDIIASITREEFEQWISRDLERIEETIDKAMSNANVGYNDIDRVFLTGGSSLIPAIRSIFINRFGEQKLTTGDQFMSIAYGLALAGQEENFIDQAMSGLPF